VAAVSSRTGFHAFTFGGEFYTGKVTSYDEPNGKVKLLYWYSDSS
jgi:hypothetical protein